MLKHKIKMNLHYFYSLFSFFYHLMVSLIFINEKYMFDSIFINGLI
jgi:hypothetical protein